MKRGALIVLEGCDRSGKSTQSKLLAEALTKNGKKAELMRFPDRSTAIGQVISSYLEQKSELQDHSIHLLFAANRWELQPQMMKLLKDGVSLVVDRYSFSGVAFSAAKKGIDLGWCKQPEVGLPKPDLVLYLDVPSSVAAGRGQFGEERYERTDFQEKVAKVYGQLKDSSWKVLDASQSIEDLQKQILETVNSYLEEGLSGKEPVGELWAHERAPASESSIDNSSTLSKDDLKRIGPVVQNGNSRPAKKICSVDPKLINYFK